MQVITLNIREKEIEQYQNCFKTMAGTSALLSGFAYGAISTPTYNQTDNLFIIKFGYLASITAAMGIGLIIIVISSFCSIFGAGLALRGNKGADSVHQAVKVMGQYFNLNLGFFMMQLLLFQVSLIFMMIILYPWPMAFGIDVILVLFLLFFLYKALDIFNKLHFRDDQAISGIITRDDSQPIVANPSQYSRQPNTVPES